MSQHSTPNAERLTLLRQGYGGQGPGRKHSTSNLQSAEFGVLSAESRSTSSGQAQEDLLHILMAVFLQRFRAAGAGDREFDGVPPIRCNLPLESRNAKPETFRS
jgi:hypothetical protein